MHHPDLAMDTDNSSRSQDPNDPKAVVQMERSESCESNVSSELKLVNIILKPMIYVLIFILVCAATFALIWAFGDSKKNHKPTNIQPIEAFKDRWISDREIMIRVHDEIRLFDVETKKYEFISLMRKYNTLCSVDISADHQFLLLSYECEKTFRHSYTAYYEVFNIKNQTTHSLKSVEGRNNKDRIQLAVWSPVGNGLAFVKQNDIYYVKSVTRLTDVVRLTDSGSSNVYNGVPDWVYEEEVFSSKRAVWFSTNGSHLAYASFNDSRVLPVELFKYGFSDNPNNPTNQYDAITRIPYPKVGTPNPVVTLFVESLNSSKPNPIPVHAPSALTDVSTDIILNTVFWSDDTNLFVIWMNRVQNESYLVRYSVTAGSADTETAVFLKQSNGWLDFMQTPLVGDDHRLAIIFPVKQSDGGSFKHVVVVEPDGNLTAVTSGKFEVIELLKWDVPSNYIYYLANTERNPEEQYMYRTIVGKHSVPECLSCNSCKYCEAHMSTKNSYYVLDCLGPNVADVEVGLYSATGEKVMVYDAHDDFKRSMSSVELQETSFMDVPVGVDHRARVKLIVPPSVDKNANGKYPLLIYTYAGPGSSHASDLKCVHYTENWNTLYGSLENVVVAIIDGRGSGRMGDRHLFAIYERLGTYEVEDQISVTKSILEQNPYLDKSKTAIWGWSYGGYVAGMALAKDRGKVFKCGVSVAPLSDLRLYDSIYTERYMGLVGENGEHYRDSSLLEHAKNIGNNTFMVIHGTFDENVHVKNTMALSSALYRSNTLFRQQIFPDEVHSLPNVNKYVFNIIQSFLSDCFQMDKS